MKNNLKIILDVNIWVSAFISPKMMQHVQAIVLQDGVEIIACQELLAELEQTLLRSKFNKYLSAERRLLAMELTEQSSTLIHPKSVVALCRDDKDDYLLALAKEAQADFLLTGDKDLLVLNPFEQTQIITLSDYVRLGTENEGV